jgi:hypothetical protein
LLKVKETVIASACNRKRTNNISVLMASVKTYEADSIPRILFASVSEHFDLLHPTSVREWIKVQEPKIIMHVFNCRPGRLANLEEWDTYMGAHLLQALTGLRFWSQDPTVFGIVPRPLEQAISNALHSQTFLLVGGRPHTLQRVLKHRMVSFASLTVSFFPFSLDIPAMATWLTGFANHATTEDIRQIVINVWNREPTCLHIANAITQLLGVDVTARGTTTVDEWAEHIRVTEVQGERDRTFIVLTNAPAPTAEDYYLFRCMIQEAPYHDHSSRRCGTGRVVGFAYCAVCRGNDHRTSGCPFPEIIPPAMKVYTGTALTNNKAVQNGGQFVGGNAIKNVPI